MPNILKIPNIQNCFPSFPHHSKQSKVQEGALFQLTEPLLFIMKFAVFLSANLLMLVSEPALSTQREIPLYIAGIKTSFFITHNANFLDLMTEETGQNIVETISITSSKSIDSESSLGEFRQALTTEQNALITSLLQDTEKIELKNTSQISSIWSFKSQNIQAEIFQAADILLSSNKTKTYRAESRNHIEVPAIPIFDSTIGQTSTSRTSRSVLFLNRISIKDRIISYAQLANREPGQSPSGEYLLAEWEFQLNSDDNFVSLNINFPDITDNTSWLKSRKRISPYKRGGKSSTFTYNPYAKTDVSGQTNICSSSQCQQISFVTSSACIVCGSLILSQVLHKQAAPFLLGQFIFNGTNIQVVISAEAIAVALKTGFTAGMCGLTTGICNCGTGAFACTYNLASRLKSKIFPPHRFTEEDFIREVSNLRLSPFNIDSSSRVIKQKTLGECTAITEQPKPAYSEIRLRTASNPTTPQNNGAVCVQVGDDINSSALLVSPVADTSFANNKKNN